MDPYSNMRHLLGILSNLVNVNSKSNYGITTIHVCVSIINVHSMLSGTRASVFFSVNVSLIEIHSFRAIFCGNVTILVNVNSKINYEIATIYVCVSIINVHPMLSDTRASAFFFVNVGFIGIHPFRAIFCGNVTILSNNIKPRYSGRMSKGIATRNFIWGIYAYVGVRLWISFSERLLWVSGCICYYGIKIREVKGILTHYWFMSRMIAKFKHSSSLMYYTFGKLVVLPIRMVGYLIKHGYSHQGNKGRLGVILNHAKRLSILGKYIIIITQYPRTSTCGEVSYLGYSRHRACSGHCIRAKRTEDFICGINSGDIILRMFFHSYNETKHVCDYGGSKNTVCFNIGLRYLQNYYKQHNFLTYLVYKSTIFYKFCTSRIGFEEISHNVVFNFSSLQPTRLKTGFNNSLLNNYGSLTMQNRFEVGHGSIKMADLSCYTQYCKHFSGVNIGQGIYRTLSAPNCGESKNRVYCNTELGNLWRYCYKEYKSWIYLQLGNFIQPRNAHTSRYGLKAISSTEVYKFFPIQSIGIRIVFNNSFLSDLDSLTTQNRFEAGCGSINMVDLAWCIQYCKHPPGVNISKGICQIFASVNALMNSYIFNSYLNSLIGSINMIKQFTYWGYSVFYRIFYQTMTGSILIYFILHIPFTGFRYPLFTGGLVYVCRENNFDLVRGKVMENLICGIISGDIIIWLFFLPCNRKEPLPNCGESVNRVYCNIARRGNLGMNYLRGIIRQVFITELCKCWFLSGNTHYTYILYGTGLFTGNKDSHVTQHGSGGKIIPYKAFGKVSCGNHYFQPSRMCEHMSIHPSNGLIYTKVVRRNSFRHNRVVMYYADHAWDIHPPLHPVIYSVSHVQENISLYWGGRASTCRSLFIHLTCCWVLPLRLGLLGIYGIGGCGSELRRRLVGNSCYSGIVCYLCNSLWEGHVSRFFSLLMSWGRK